MRRANNERIPAFISAMLTSPLSLPSIDDKNAFHLFNIECLLFNRAVSRRGLYSSLFCFWIWCHMIINMMLYRYDIRNSLLFQTHLALLFTVRVIAALWDSGQRRHADIADFPFWHLKINFKIHHQRNLTPLYAKGLLSIAGRVSVRAICATRKLRIPVFNSLCSFSQNQKKCSWRLTVHSEPSSPAETVIAEKNECELHHKPEIAFHVDRAHLSVPATTTAPRSITSLMKFHVWCC